MKVGSGVLDERVPAPVDPSPVDPLPPEAFYVGSVAVDVTSAHYDFVAADTAVTTGKVRRHVTKFRSEPNLEPSSW